MTDLNLTKNQRMVLGALQSEDKPCTAYELLDILRTDGFKAPPQVYRALSALLNKGVIHRLESQNAYVVCCQPECGKGHKVVAFTICETCGAVSEFALSAIEADVSEWSAQAGFQAQQAVLEVRGVCSACTG